MLYPRKAFHTNDRESNPSYFLFNEFFVGEREGEKWERGHDRARAPLDGGGGRMVIGSHPFKWLNVNAG